MRQFSRLQTKTSLRTAIAALPFVTATGKSLNMWDVPGTGRLSADVDAGREYAGMLIHLMREYSAPHVLYNVLAAWRLYPPLAGDTRTGFLRVLWETVSAAPSNATIQMQVVAAMKMSDDEEAAVLDLPYVRRLPGGEVSLWSVRATGDYSEDCAYGRFMAARAAQFMQKFPRSDVPYRCYRSCAQNISAAEEAVRIGFTHELAEIVIAAKCDATPTLRSALPIYQSRMELA